MSTILATQTPAAATSVPPLDIKALTAAPLRYVMTVPVSAAVSETLPIVLQLERVADYLSSIKAASVRCDADGHPEARVCTISGMGKVEEAIRWFDPEQGYAYSADAPGLPMKQHLGVATVQPHDDGSMVRWESYFNWKGVLKPVMMKVMFPSMMRSLGDGLQGDLGAAGPVEGRWC